MCLSRCLWREISLIYGLLPAQGWAGMPTSFKWVNKGERKESPFFSLSFPVPMRPWGIQAIKELIRSWSEGRTSFPAHTKHIHFICREFLCSPGGSWEWAHKVAGQLLKRGKRIPTLKAHIHLESHDCCVRVSIHHLLWNRTCWILFCSFQVPSAHRSHWEEKLDWITISVCSMLPGPLNRDDGNPWTIALSADRMRRDVSPDILSAGARGDATVREACSWLDVKTSSKWTNKFS